jgi:predicted PurR-regulated permease PerM
MSGRRLRRHHRPGRGRHRRCVIVFVLVVVSNGSVESAVNAWAVGGRLKLHPVMVLVTTAVPAWWEASR